MSADISKQLDIVVRHIQSVQQNCILLGERLIGKGEIELGKSLIANSLSHDQSKFKGIEWDNLSVPNPDAETLKLAVAHHNKTNPHHPEYWADGIKDMPRVFLAEMICDWKARSNEFGTSLSEWIENEAMKRFSFTKKDKVWKEIKYFLELLLDVPFKRIDG